MLLDSFVYIFIVPLMIIYNSELIDACIGWDDGNQLIQDATPTTCVPFYLPMQINSFIN